MKKRLIAFVSMLMALVMCFALVACDGEAPTKPENPNGPVDPVDPGKDPIKPPVGSASMSYKQALEAVDKLLSGVDGWTGEASFTLSTANTEETKGAVSLEKRGDRFEIKGGDQTLIYDVNTGYAYLKHPDGYYASQMTTGGVLDYVKYLGGSLLTDDMTDGSFYYDEKTMTAHYELDFAKKINDALAPLYDAYKKGKTVNALLNAYCTQYIGLSFDDIHTAVKAMVDVYREYTVNDVLTMLKALDIDVLAILKENGIEITEEDMKIYGPRKIEAMVAGAYVYINDMMAQTTAEEEPTEPIEGDGMEAVLAGLLNAMFMEEYEEKVIDEAFKNIDTVIAGALEMKVNKLIDDNKDMLPNELYVMIVNGVKLQALKLEFDVVFDKDKNVSAFNVAAQFKHDYKGATEGLDVLADNDYYAEATLKIDEYTIVEEPFIIEVAEGGANLYSTVSYIVSNVDGKTVSAYYEFGCEMTIAPENIKIYVGDLFDEPTPVENARSVMFNTVTSCFEFDGEFVAAFFDDKAQAGYTISIVAAYGEGEDEFVTVVLVYMNDDVDQIMALIQKAADALTPTDPDVPSIDDEVVEVYAA